MYQNQSSSSFLAVNLVHTLLYFFLPDFDEKTKVNTCSLRCAQSNPIHTKLSSPNSKTLITKIQRFLHGS